MTINPYSGFTSRPSGYIVTATEWNAEFTNFINYVNSTFQAPLNTLSSTKGNILTADGTNLQILGVGTNGQALIANSAAAYGVNWASVANVATLTTKGDLLTYSGSANVRLGVGTDGQVLTSRSGATNGIDWETPAAAAVIPSGVIVSYNPSYGGNSIPTGWTLCDGNNSTPNLIGVFVLGGQLTGGSSTPATGGYGNQTPNTSQGATTLTVGVSIGGNTSALSAQTVFGTSGGSPLASVAAAGQTPSFAGSGTAFPGFQPASYVLVYIQKN